MRVKARRVGNSITVTIPKEIAEDMGITPDTEMDLAVERGTVVLKPAQTRWERLVAEVRRQAVARGMTEEDVDRAVMEYRGRGA